MSIMMRRILMWGTLGLLVAAGLTFAFWPRPYLVDLARVGRAPLVVTLDERQLEHGLTLLRQLGALPETQYALTEKGKQLASLPVHPRLGAILLRAVEVGRLPLGATVAALASERDIRRIDIGESQGASAQDVDFDYRIDLLEEFEKSGGTAELISALYRDG